MKETFRIVKKFASHPNQTPAAVNASFSEEHRRLIALFDLVPGFVRLVACNHSVKFANQQYWKLFGERIKSCFELFGRKAPCAHCPTLSPQVMSSGFGQWKGPHLRLYEVHNYPFRDADGALNVLELGFDITKRKKVEQARRDSEKQLRSISAQLMNAHETEREQISREMHDELGQALSALKLRISFIRKHLSTGQIALVNECDEITQYLDQIIENVRKISRDLSPRILEDLGLVAALQRMIKQFAKLGSFRVECSIENVDHLLPREKEICIYRVFQEALANIERHARATNVLVAVEKQKGHIYCHIEDDGCGFDPSSREMDHDEKGMGLAIMRERVRMLGAMLQLESAEGQGARISFRFPAGNTNA
jgi:signal transduction histidine kinase